MDRFSKLPAELLGQVLLSVGNIKDILAISGASPYMRSLVRESRAYVFRRVMSREFENPLIIQDVMAIVELRAMSKTTGSRSQWISNIESLLAKWDNNGFTNPFNSPDVLTLAKMDMIYRQCYNFMQTKFCRRLQVLRFQNTWWETLPGTTSSGRSIPDHELKNVLKVLLDTFFEHMDPESRRVTLQAFLRDKFYRSIRFITCRKGLKAPEEPRNRSVVDHYQMLEARHRTECVEPCKRELQDAMFRAVCNDRIANTVPDFSPVGVLEPESEREVRDQTLMNELRRRLRDRDQ